MNIFDLITKTENNQAQFTNPAITVKKNKQTSSTVFGGIGLVRNLIEKLEIDKIVNQELKILERHNPYFESDHILTFLYNFLTGGETIFDIERLQNDKAFKKILGTENIPDPPTGADFSYNKKWSYNPIYFTIAELGDLLCADLRGGNIYSSDNASTKLKEIIPRLKTHFKKIRVRGDSAFYDRKILNVCKEENAEYFITADQYDKIIKKVMEIEENEWEEFKKKKKTAKEKRIKRINLKKKIENKRKERMKYKGKKQIAEFFYKPSGWEKELRYVVTRTKIVDKNGQQYINDGYCEYVFHIVVTNSKLEKEKVMRIAGKRSNQENLIKDFKYGLGLSHIPTGFFIANKVYFLLAMLAWNIKTWILNILKLGDGSVVRFKRFLYKNIYHICHISKTGRNMIYYRINNNYFDVFNNSLLFMKILK